MRLVVGAAVVLTACAHLPIAPPSEGVFFDGAGRAIPETEVARRIEAARFVLVGEQHDNRCDHREEARLTALAGLAGPFALGLEMVDVDAQPVLDAFDADHLGLDHLAAALDWKASWGFNFDWYAPVFAAAHAAHAPVVGLNVPARLIHRVRDGGLEALSVDERLHTTPRLWPPPPGEQAMLRAAFEEHRHAGRAGGSDEAAAWNRFVRVQSLWDSQMAWQAARVAELLGRRVVVLAGIGHVEQGWGIAARLRAVAPGTRVLTILPWRGDARPDGADLYFFCPEEAGR